jgi:hypothetical protein
MATRRIRQQDIIDRLNERQDAIDLMRECEAILKLLYIDEQGLHVDRNITQRAMRIALDKLNEARSTLQLGTELIKVTLNSAR